MGALPSLESFSLRQLIGQLIVVRSSGFLFDGDRHYPQWEADHQTLKTWISEQSVGGVILLGGSAAEVAFKTKQLQDWAEIPLLMAADIEEGVGQRFASATEFPPPMALAEIYRQDPQQAIALATQMGEITAQEALSIGINWILAPVMDVNNNPANPVINVRAFGETPEEVAALGSAFIRGTQKYPVLTTAKHFPGHGDTAADSHIDLPTIPHTLQRLQEVELPPFQQAIASSVDSVMTAHLILEQLDPDKPATLSPKILTHLLRNQLQFEGLIVTDALMMAGVTQFADPAEVVVFALEAGADILLMPPDVEGAIASIEAAIKSGRLTIERLKKSVTRILNAKQKLIAAQKKLPVPFPEAIASQRSSAITLEILEKSSRHNSCNTLLPNLQTSEAQNLIMVDSLLKQNFLQPNCPAIAIPQAHGFTPQLITLDQYKNYNFNPLPTIIQIFTRGNPFAGQLISPLSLLQKLSHQVDIQAIIHYGSPYFTTAIFQQFTNIPCIFTYGQMTTAQTFTCTKLWNQGWQSHPEQREFT